MHQIGEVCLPFFEQSFVNETRIFVYRLFFLFVPAGAVSCQRIWTQSVLSTKGGISGGWTNGFSTENATKFTLAIT